jgi:ferredoxin
MNLIQLALAAEEFVHGQPVIQFTQTQCVRDKNIHATCDLCVNVCPTGAIRLDSEIPELIVEKCIRCGVCLYACPIGAFERYDGLYKLLHCAEFIVDHEILDIACAHHPSPAITDGSSDGVIQTNNCLSGLGYSAYIGLLAVGVQNIRVRVDACSTCPLRVLQTQIEHSVANTLRILSLFGFEERIKIVSSADPTWRKLPLYDSQNMPVSRRAFFSVLSPETSSVSRTIVPVDEDQPETGKYTPRERRRLLTALRMLVDSNTDLPPHATIEAIGFAQFNVLSSCTACGLCERVCPTEALRVDKCDTTFAITFAPHLCTDCGLCVGYCETGALRPSGGPLASHVLNGNVIQLHEGTLQQCTRCKTRFSDQNGETLCSVCRYRRENPSGMMLPDLLFKLPEETRRRLKRQHQNPAT